MTAHLNVEILPHWPKLAWVACCRPGAQRVDARCGPLVHIAERWFAEAVWAGDFENGDFDATELMVGSGVRVRDGQCIFASSGSAMDRLWYCFHEGCWHVSNTLPGLLATTGLRLRDDYAGYVDDIQSINCGRGHVHDHVRHIPSTGADLHVAYFVNLAFDGKELHETAKPDLTPTLHSFNDYYRFLAETARAMGANARAPARTVPAVPVSTISAGYDAAAVAAIAKYAGCEATITISNPTSLSRRTDSGRDIAQILGVRCREYQHSPSLYRGEEAIWAATGQPRGLNYTVFDFAEPLCLLFTGNYGEMAWDLGMVKYLEPASDLSGLCLTEFRLLHGILHCVPACWGVHHLAEIRAIGHAEEMRPWRLGNSYDRPIPRRILEDAGVPRSAFGMENMNTSSHAEFWWPYSRASQESFRSYLDNLGLYAPGPFLAGTLRRTAKVENLVYKNLLKRFGFKRRLRPWRRIAGTRHLFQWANHELLAHYAEAPGRPAG